MAIFSPKMAMILPMGWTPLYVHPQKFPMTFFQ